MSLGLVAASEAVEFVSAWHYAGSAAAGLLRFGWRIDGELAGVSIYDNGIHAVRTGVFGAEHFRHVVHHHRLALHPAAPQFSASQFIGACHRWMRVNRPDIWAVVTYADRCEGHNGTIYQATNAVYTGLFAKGNLKFKDQSGHLHGTQTLASVGPWPERRAEAARRGWTEHRCLGKDRYVYLLGTATQRRARPAMLWEARPYPAPMEPVAAEVH